MVISTKMIWFGDILHTSLEQHNYFIKKKKAFNTWVSFTEHLQLFLFFLERQASL